MRQGRTSLALPAASARQHCWCRNRGDRSGSPTAAPTDSDLAVTVVQSARDSTAGYESPTTSLWASSDLVNRLRSPQHERFQILWLNSDSFGKTDRSKPPNARSAMLGAMPCAEHTKVQWPSVCNLKSQAAGSRLLHHLHDVESLPS